VKDNIMTAQPRRKRELTGRAVLLWFIGFFGVVFAVNGVLVQAATSTFRGMETASSYKAGLLFKADVESAQRQEDLHWQVDGKLSRDRAGEAVLEFNARDGKGAALTGLTAAARFAHPADASLDRTMELKPAGAGVFRGVADAQPGQWELIVDLFRGDERVYRSRSRVMLR
jgi:nitrogen fixation protein FixH